jgi:hypothetical protein
LPPVLPWRAQAHELARWVWEHLVNRTDAWGGYYRVQGADGKWITRQTTHPREGARGQVFLTRGTLSLHFNTVSTSAVCGLHSTSPDNTSRWGAIDVDHHGPTSTAPEVNWQAALSWYERLRRAGFRPLLTDSNGKGGYHLLVLLAQAIQTARVHHFLKALVADHAQYGMPVPPEVFPKQPCVAPPGQPGQYGNWLRLPGRHHTRAHWSRVWDGSHWLEGAEAISFILALTGDSPDLIPTELPPPPAPTPRIIQPGQRVWTPSGSRVRGKGLDGRIEAYMARLPHLGEGQGRDDVAYHFACWLTRDLALDDARALQWLARWDAGNRPPKGPDRLVEILESARRYGRKPVGAGLGTTPARGHKQGRYFTMTFPARG